MTTFKSFTDNLGDLEITGVNYLLDEPPTSLNDLPAQWVNFPSENQTALTFKAHGGWPTLTAQLVVALESVGQNTQVANWSKAVTLLDNVSTALSGAVGTFAKGKVEWTSRIGEVLVGEISYWAVITDVTAHG